VKSTQLSSDTSKKRLYEVVELIKKSAPHDRNFAPSSLLIAKFFADGVDALTGCVTQ
jgi:hypothetical protein